MLSSVLRGKRAVMVNIEIMRAFVRLRQILGAHATSAAHALRELIPGAALSALMPPQQNAVSVAAWIRESVAVAGARKAA